jgi:xylulokinase
MSNAQRLVAGVDSSTQSTKVEVREAVSGRVVARTSAPHPPTTPPRSEQDPMAWWQAFESAWAEAMRIAGVSRVDAISVAGQQHGMVVLDSDRQPVRPAKLWNDTESAPDAGWLVKQLGGAEAWAAAVGSVPVAAFTATKLSWLHRSEPESWQRLAHVLLPHDWMTLQLTGNLVTDRGDASGTGYWSAQHGEYDWSILKIIDSERDWSQVVPRVAAAGEQVGEWNGAAVACGTGDNMAAALGLGLAAGEAVISLGTSGTVFSVSDVATNDPSGAVAGFADATGRFLPLVCTLNATKVTNAFALDGERTPNLPTASGSLVGLRSDVAREDIARAAVEGVACGLLDGLDALQRHAAVRSITLVGGGARSAAYRHVLAELCELPVTVADADEAVATGACVQAAAVALGMAHDEVVAQWGLAARTPVAHGHGGASAQTVRDRYAQARRQAHPES